MGSYSSAMQPHELVEHRKLNTAVENVEIPARPDSRKITDKKGFIIFGIAILILLPFLIYSMTKSDLRHLTHQTDNCGNFCGEKNVKIDGISCSGIDYTDKPYGDALRCQSSCPSGDKECKKSWDLDEEELESDIENTQIFFGTIDDDDVHVSINPLKAEWWKFILSIFFTIALSILTLVLLRYMPAPVIWFIIIFCMTVLALLVLGVWVFYFSINEEATGKEVDATPVLAVAVIWTFFASIIFIVFIVLFKRIGLVVQLYKEATKALAAMPLLVLVPIITAIIQVIIVIIAILTTASVLSARELKKLGDDFYIYQQSGVIIFTIIFNIIVTIWTMRLIGGIQYMIVSGSVSTWYFARNKDYLGSPIIGSLKITLKYHLGTIAFGSFLLTLFSVVKAILRVCCRNACCRCCFTMCCTSVEIVFRFLSENAYIETGMHGQSFIRSAKRATKLLMANISSVIAINCVGDFVLAIIVLILTILATGISYALFMSMGYEYAVIPTIICLLVNLIIVCIIFATFQAIIDTLFICFCEDSVLNDGLSRPYYMSRGLMEFVENSKKLYGK